MKPAELEKENSPLLKNEKAEKICISNNLLFSVLGFFGYFNVYSLRVNMSVAMVAMVKQLPSNSTKSSECPILSGNSSLKYVQDGEFDWSSLTQGLILGSFFYGYVSTHILGGYLSLKFGGKRVFGVGVFLTAFLTLFTPLAARLNATALVFLRVLEGMAEGVTSPSMHLLIATRIPKYQRSLATTFIYSGALMGTVVSMPIAGALCSSDFLGGWPSAFYIFGALGCLWSIFWFPMIPNTVSLPHISANDNTRYIPWLSFMKSSAVWILIITSLGQGWGFIMVLTELPNYMSTVLRYDVKENAILSALPYLFQAISGWICGFIADYVYKNGYVRLSVIRKTCNSVGYFGTALCLIGVVIAGCNHNLSVMFFTLSMFSNGFVNAGYFVSIIDIAPDFAGALIGIISTVSNIPGFLAPTIVGYMTQEENSVRTWGNVFYMTAGFYVITNIVYIIFGTTELQPWGIARSETKESTSTESDSKTSLNTECNGSIYQSIPNLCNGNA